MENTFAWGQSSKKRLATVHPKLKELADECLRRSKIDITVVCGRRTKQYQDKAFAEGRSKVQWPNSKHNVKNPNDLATAIDFQWMIPYPSKVSRESYVKTIAQWYMWGQFVQDVAYDLTIDIRWGGDWDRDWDIQDQSFDDLPHFEYKGHR